MSGSLIHESETRTNVALDDFEKTIKLLFENEFSRTTIGQAVRDFEETRQEELGNYAKFWTLLAIGAILAHPKSYRAKISLYLAKADECLDKSEEWRHDFYIDLQTELKRRYDAEDIKIQSHARLPYIAPYFHTIRMLGGS